MNVSVRAIRDEDGVSLGEAVFDFTDASARRTAVAQLLQQVYENSADPLNLPPFTFRFDKAGN